MSKEIKVSNTDIADDLLLKKQLVNINSKNINTPIKTISARNCRSDIQINNDVKGLNEIYTSFNEKTLLEYLDGKRSYLKQNKRIKNMIGKTREDEVVLTFVSYTGYNYPIRKGIDFLTNISYLNSDATVLPLLPYIFKNDNRDFRDKLTDYTKFMRECIDSINRLNNKAIIGVIPAAIPPPLISELIEFYYDNNIKSFVFDFMGNKPNVVDLQVREMMACLNGPEYQLLGKSFFYAINANSGKLLHDFPVVEAKEYLAFGYGFDALGDNHFIKRIPKNVSELIRLVNRGKDPIRRLFNNVDYGYYKTSELNILKNVYPDDTSIPFSVFENYKTNKVKAIDAQILYNNERLGIEAIKYRDLIREEKEKTSEYFKRKTYVNNREILNLQEFRKNVDL
ncbi:hypothetical protein Mtc_0630 [Methanocella conradii HZ254]|uniref:Uncharacterized protein n=1 Tax=Methanocella conradii (strain DSM 24694 / JCM 17849 / CGMCC 1.5162 / HZ254) TaxID=1041930 RepID=H8I6S3_METCZ|nr:hypothetical protein [Methanocella conradii]AFC99393.1 hypothetical protein Mtc_0630 [Methanocella conradii HZ254]